MHNYLDTLADIILRPASHAAETGRSQAAMDELSALCEEQAADLQAQGYGVMPDYLVEQHAHPLAVDGGDVGGLSVWDTEQSSADPRGLPPRKVRVTCSTWEEHGLFAVRRLSGEAFAKHVEHQRALRARHGIRQECDRARRAQRAAAKRAAETPEQREQRLAKQRQRQRALRAKRRA
jgi:hypothetical protein